MKKMKTLSILTLSLLLALGMLAMTGCGGGDEGSGEAASAEEEGALTIAEAEVPDVVQAKIDEVRSYAQKYAEQLSPDYADKYVALLESGEARDYADYEALKGELDAIRVECGATYVYILSPAKDGEPSVDGDAGASGAFLITVDGSEDPDDWGLDYGWEIQFEEAWNGEAAAARSAWADDEEGTELCWSAFAPLKNSDGEVVGLLGIDFPANEILDYPEWNRDADEWNGIEE